ncbi:MAG: V-type ATPase subunit [Planctomycetota bacterium]|nr:V-type ATPase subunit [Planctomycetota bacterium]
MKYWNTAALFRENTRYAYAVGNIRAQEPSLLDRSVFDRLAEARDSETVGRILAETAYGGVVAHLSSRSDWERALEAERARVLELGEKLFQSPRYLELIRVREDFHNVRLALKQKYLGPAAEDAYSAHGTIPPDRIKTAAHEEDWTKLPRHVADAGAALVSALGSRRPQEQAGGGAPALPASAGPQVDGVTIDEHVDRRMFACLLELSRKLPSRFFVELAKLEIDLYNIGVMLRARRRKGKPGSWDSSFIAGGTLPRESLAACTAASIEEIALTLSQSELATVVQDAAAYLDSKGSFARFERLSGESRAEFLHLARFVSMGPEPVFVFVRRKLRETEMLRILLVGKQNKVDDAVLAEYAGA